MNDKLLYIKASPRTERSYSLRVTEAFVDSFSQTNPDWTVDTLDLFAEDLPEFDGPTIQAKYNIMHGRDHTQAQLDAWAKIEKVIDRFKGAKKYVAAIPMWNFGIPYKLKHYIDLISQPTYTFKVDPEKGYQGLVTDKPFFAAYARGGQYPDDSPMDFQKKYVESQLAFIGFTDIRSIIVEPTLGKGPDVAKEHLEIAIDQARSMAAIF